MSVNILLAKNIVVGIPAHCENCKYLESIADTSVIVYDEIINATDGVSTNMTNATPTNMTNTNLINVMSTMCQYTLMIKMQDIKWIVMFCTQYYTNKYDKYYINKCISAQKKTY